MKSHLMNKKNMAQSCRVSATAFDKWGVTPVERKGREAFYDVASVIDNRVNNAINQLTNDKGPKVRFQHLSFPFFLGGILNKNIKLRRRRTEMP